MTLNLLNKTGLFSILIVALLCAANSVFAQHEQTIIEEDDVPPPLITLSTQETTQLNASTDNKERTKLCVELANERLLRAETLTNDADFEKALSELAGYQAVIENGLKYLHSQNSDNRKMRDNLKRLELALRAHAPRIETIRRSTPFSFGKYVKKVLHFARDARSRALETFFSDNVVRAETSGDAATTNAATTAAKP